MRQKLRPWFATTGLVLAWLASFMNYFGQRFNWEWARKGFKGDDPNKKLCGALIITAIVLGIPVYARVPCRSFEKRSVP